MIEKIALIGLSILVFTLVSILTRLKKSLADWLLCAWLVVIGLAMLRAMHVNVTIAGFSLWDLYNPTFNLLHGPLLYFYVRLLTQIRPVFIRTDLIHLAPFILFGLFSLFTDASRRMVPGFNPGRETITYNSNVFVAGIENLLLHFAMLNVVSFLVYSGVVVWLLVQHQHKITSYFSRRDPQISLTWIYALPATFLMITFVNLLNENGLMRLPIVEPLTLHILSHCCLAILLCFFGVRQKPVFEVGTELNRSKGDAPSESVKDEVAVDSPSCEPVENKSQPEPNKPLLEHDEVETYKTQVHHYMLNERQFLNPDFSVYLLAEALEIPRHTLSFVLSRGFDKNFYQFVNSYRLEEMKAQLSDTGNKETILDIAFACGFSSKSTYNTLFKKQCGCTPTQFRKLAQKPRTC